MRRHPFARRFVAAFALLLIAPPAYAQSAPTLRVAFAGDTTTAFGLSALRGVRAGSNEAAHTASLMGSSYILTILQAPGNSTIEIPSNVDVLISAVPASQVRTAALILDLLPLSRDTHCGERILHLSIPAGKDTHVWGASLVRFGAQELNERYTRATGVAMDDGAWLGWFASKVAIDLHVRARSTNADSLARFAHSPRARFDGQKGKSLVFNAAGVLIQPAYVTGADGALSESTEPVRWLCPGGA